MVSNTKFKLYFLQFISYQMCLCVQISSIFLAHYVLYLFSSENPGYFSFFYKQINSKTRDGFTVNSKVPSMKDPKKEYDGFTITITGDRYGSCRLKHTCTYHTMLLFYYDKDI